MLDVCTHTHTLYARPNDCFILLSDTQQYPMIRDFYNLRLISKNFDHNYSHPLNYT